MSKKTSLTSTIVLAAVLKPATETRMYHKLAYTLQRYFREATIYSLGAPFQMSEAISSVIPLTLYTQGRRHLSRWWVGLTFLRYLWQLKPDLCVICAVELLPWAVLYKFFHRKTLLVYDVQENYAANIRYTSTYPTLLKQPLAWWVRKVEQTCSYWLDAFWLAEHCYQKELSFVHQHPYVVLANKFLPPPDFRLLEKPTQGTHQFLLAGTIGESYGVFEAIAFIKSLHQIDSRVSLNIYGYCASERDRKKIREAVQGSPFIRVLHLDTPLPHLKILEAIQKADGVLLPYRPQAHLQERLPTKFFECLALQTPMVITHNPFWEDYLKEYKTVAFFIDFRQRNDLSSFYQRFQQHRQQEVVGGSVSKDHLFWQSEARKLTDFLEKYFTR